MKDDTLEAKRNVTKSEQMKSKGEGKPDSQNETMPAPGPKNLSEDEIKRLVSSDRKRALALARRNLDDGLAILVQLLESQGFPEPEVSDSREVLWDTDPDFVFCAFFRRITEALINNARAGNTRAVGQAWDASSRLINMIHALAKQNPGLLKPFARKALFLPAFRANVKKFTHDFQRVQEAIELSQDCFINTDLDALVDLESPATSLVAARLEAVGRIREDMKTMQKAWQHFCENSNPASSYTLPEWLVQIGGFQPEELFLLELPDYDKNSALEWWERVIKPYLADPKTLDSIRGTPFYQSLCDGAETPKDSDVRDRLKERCRPKVLRSLAPQVPRKPGGI